MITVKGSFRNGVAQPQEAVNGHEGQEVLITFLENGTPAVPAYDDHSPIYADHLPTLDEFVAKIRAEKSDPVLYEPATESAADLLARARDEEPIDSAEFDRQWAEIEAYMKARDRADDVREGRL